MTVIKNPQVAAVFQAYPPKLRPKLLALRKLILETAEATEGGGEIEETLKWGEPVYVTTETKSGSTLRIDWKEALPERVLGLVPLPDQSCGYLSRVVSQGAPLRWRSPHRVR